MMFDSLMAFRKLMAATFLMFAAAIPATTAGAQQIVVIVNGEPITALDVDQRSKLSQLSTHKVPPRQEVLDELINERLKLREAKKFGLDVSVSEVDTAYASMAGRMRFTADQLTQQLARSGVNVSTLKARIKADIAWAQIVRGRYQASLQLGRHSCGAAQGSRGHRGRPPDAARDHQVRRRDVCDLRQEGIVGGQLARQAPGQREPDGQTLRATIQAISARDPARRDARIQVRLKRYATAFGADAG